MLEEALRNDKQRPAETALAMLSFLQNELPAGGAAAEGRFFRLYGPLCDRIFGPIGTEKEGYRHKEGGWLSVQNAWSQSTNTNGSGRSPASGSSHHRGVASLASAATLSRKGTSSIETDPVVKLLGTAPKPDSSVKDASPLPMTLIEAISKESRNRPDIGFSFPLHALPKATQDAWMAMLDQQPQALNIFMGSVQSRPFTPAACSRNDARLLKELLQKPPNEQRELWHYKQRQELKKAVLTGPNSSVRGPLQLSPLGRHGPMSTTSPRAFSTPSSPYQFSPDTASLGKSIGETTETEEATPPNVLLGMLEHFLFVFVRYPLFPSIPKLNAPTPGGANNSAARSLIHARQNRETYGETVYNNLFRRYVKYFLPYEREGDRHLDFGSSMHESELFLRVVILMWLEADIRLMTTVQLIQKLKERRKLAGIVALAKYNLHDSYDLAQGTYTSSSSLTQRCLRNVVVHLMLDPSLPEVVRRQASSSQRKWCLSTATTVFKQPFYNHLRATFRYASMHSIESPFFAAINAWLIWLEPWNVNESKTREFTQTSTSHRIMGSVGVVASPRTITIPKHNQSSRYEPFWEPYIAANLHLYTVPLAIFLCRARELDFSERNFDHSIQLVKRVFRVFTAEVVDVISRHLKGTSEYSYLVQQEAQHLEPYAPPSGSMTLSSCQNDMIALLEEIQMQHTKKVRELDFTDRITAYIEGMFGGGAMSGEEKSFKWLIERGTLIVHWPQNKEILTLETNCKHKKTDGGNSFPKKQFVDRTGDGLLSEQGYKQLMTGLLKLRPDDVEYIGDTMCSRVMSHELDLLVDGTIRLSNWANRKLGLERPTLKYFRINLRFLADYRTVIFLILSAILLTRVL